MFLVEWHGDSSTLIHYNMHSLSLCKGSLQNCTKDWLGVGYKDRLSMLHLRHSGESKKLKAFIVKIKKELSETKERVRRMQLMQSIGLIRGHYKNMTWDRYKDISTGVWKSSLFISLSPGGLIEASVGESSRGRGGAGGVEGAASVGTRGEGGTPETDGPDSSQHAG